NTEAPSTNDALPRSAAAQLGEKGGPGLGSNPERVAGRVLRVAHANRGRGEPHFDTAVIAGHAVAALEPAGVMDHGLDPFVRSAMRVRDAPALIPSPSIVSNARINRPVSTGSSR